MLSRSLVAGLTGQGLGLEAARGLVNGSGDGMAKVLALMNVKYVVVHNDAAWSYVINNSWYVSPNPDQIASSLNNQTGFTFEKSFGKLDFDLTDYWTPMRVYTVSSSILLDGSQSQIVQAVQRPDFVLNESVLALSSQLDTGQAVNLPMDTVFVQTPDLNMTYAPVSNVEAGQRLVYLLNSNVAAEARYYSGWKGIISTNRTGDGSMLVYSSPSACPYIHYFPLGFVNWSSYDSTLIYVSSSSPVTITSITADGVPVYGQAWWPTGTSWEFGWPITIPANQEAIIQVSTKASSITLQTDNGPVTIPVGDGLKDPLAVLDSSQTKISTPESADYLLAVYKNSFSYGDLSVKIDNQTYRVDPSQNQTPDPAHCPPHPPQDRIPVR